MQIRNLHSHLGAQIDGVSATAVNAGDVDRLKTALAEHTVIALRDQKLAPADLVAFAERFGPVEFAVREQFWHPDVPKVYVISNIVENGKPLGNPNDGFGWHSDQTVMEYPTAYTFLYCVEGPPEGADTQFCETYSVYDELPADLKERYAGIRMTFSHDRLHASRPNATPLTEEQRRKAPDVVHPLVRTHPLSGRKSLYLGRPTYVRPHGMSEEEGAKLLMGFYAAATRPERVYAHKWRPNDLVIWDNRGALHTATEYDKKKYRRLMHRVSVVGEKPH